MCTSSRFCNYYCTFAAAPIKQTDAIIVWSVAQDPITPRTAVNQVEIRTTLNEFYFRLNIYHHVAISCSISSFKILKKE